MSELELLNYAICRHAWVVCKFVSTQVRKHSSRVARVSQSHFLSRLYTAPRLLCVYLALVALPPFEHACAVVLEPRVEEAEHLRSSMAVARKESLAC